MKKIIMAIILMLSLLSVVSAEENQQALNEITYKQIVIEQNAKTNALIKQELAKRDELMEANIKAYVDTNFGVLDGRINDFIKKATFKLGMVFLSGTVLGGTLLLLINNSLRRKKAIKKHLPDTHETLILSGKTLVKLDQQEAFDDDDDEVEVLKQQLANIEAEKKVLKKTVKEVFVEPSSIKDKTIKPMGGF